MDPVSKMDLNDSDESDSLKSCGLDDIESWISLLNEEVFENFTTDLDAFFSKDLLDEDLDINFQKPMEKMAQSGGYEPLEMDSRQTAATMVQFSQYPGFPQPAVVQQGEDQRSSSQYIVQPNYPESRRLSSNKMAQSGRYEPLEMDSRQTAATMVQFSQYPGFPQPSVVQQGEDQRSSSQYIVQPNYPESRRLSSNKMAQSGGYEPLEMDSRQTAATMVQFSQYPGFPQPAVVQQGEDQRSSSQYIVQPNYPESRRLSSNKMAQSGRYEPLEMDSRQTAATMVQFSQYPGFPQPSVVQQGEDQRSSSQYIVQPNYPESRRLSSNKLHELTEAIELYKRENMQDKECDDEVPSPKSHAVLLSYGVSFELRSIINILKGMSNNELHSVLQSLKFEHVLDLFDCISHLVKKDLEIELCQTCAKILTNFNLERLLSSKQHHQIMIHLKDLLFGSKAPLVSLQQDYIDKSSSESSLLKGGTIRYKGWTWVSNKTETPRNESIKEISNTDRDTPIESYFPEISSSSSSSGPPTGVPQAIEEGIAPIESYFPEMSSSSSSSGPPTSVPQAIEEAIAPFNPSPSYDSQGQLIICARCGYLKMTNDRINFVRAECMHVYCRTCANFVFSRRNKTKPHRCFNCNSIIHAAFNRHVKT